MRRPDLEARLDALTGVTWRYERALPVDQIDLPSSASLQYRLEKVDDATVERYAADMARGDRFPAVIVRESRNRLALIGGNHRRAAAARAGIATLPAYVIGCDARTARLLSFEDNRTHGLPLTVMERAVLGARLVEIDGMAAREAAATVGIAEQHIYNALAAERGTKRAATLGLPEAFAGLSLGARERLQSIDDDGLFAEAARVVLATGIGGNTVADLVRKIKTADSTEDAYDRVDAVASARSGYRGVERKDLSKLTDHAYGILDVNPVKAAAGIAPGEERLWRDRLKRVAVHLMEIDRALAARRGSEAA